MIEINRGDIFYADLGKDIKKSSVQKGIRPVIIVSNNRGNRYSTTVIVIPITSQLKKVELPVHIVITKDEKNGLELNSVALLEQIITIDKEKLFSKIGTICNTDMKKINYGLNISLGL